MSSIFSDIFVGKRVLITGAGKGLGRALVHELHKLQATVLAVTRSQEDLDSLVEECPSIHAICLDISDWDKTRETLEAELVEPVDILINNAAIAMREHFLDISQETLDSLIDVNFKAVVNVTQICLKKLVAEGKGGCVINVSSIGARRPQPQVSTYCDLKAAVDTLTKSIAIELGPKKIRAVSVTLGVMKTNMVAKAFPTEESILQYKSSIAKNLLLGELFVPLEQAVASILFVASGLVDMITGSAIVVDGGFTAA